MDSPPKLSVMMGVYNIEKLDVFDCAVESVLTQTMSDFEFIICDDGSTDYTAEILKKWSSQDSRIRLVQASRNEGLAAALNRCLWTAQGSFIARQDADDLSLPTRFEMQLAFLKAHTEVSFVGCDVTLWDKHGNWGERRFPAFPVERDFLFTMPFVHGTLVFRHAALKAVGGYRVAKETRRTEDYDLLMRMYSQGLRGGNLSAQLYRFREDKAAQKRRKYRYRIDEAKVRWQGFRALGLMPSALPYVVKPLIVGGIPSGMLRRLKQKRMF